MIGIVAWMLAAAVSLPVLVLVVECLAALLPYREVQPAIDPPPFAVIVPAHDEAGGIGATLTAIGAQLRPCDCLLVVADNCSDATAMVALAAGAEVVERFDSRRRGKGFALAAGRDHLAAAPPAVVIVIDADCLPEPGSLFLLAAEAARSAAAVQGLYLLGVPAEPRPMVELSSFAFLVKNLVRQRGLRRLGAPAHLQGTGMAFPWPLFARAPLANPSLVEDLALGLDLVLAGHAARFVESAIVTSPPSSQAATVTQRTRWEHGMVATARRYAPRLLRATVAGRGCLLLLTLDLLVPPLALLVLAAMAATLAELALFLVTGSSGPLLWLLATSGLLAAALALVWGRFGRRHLRLRTLLRVPQYLLWKLPIYGRLLFDRQRAWVRTGREA